MKWLLLLFLAFIPLVPRVHALYDPLSVPNNQFGIHIADVNDIPDIPVLVNSSGGDWGYVTFVIAENDRDPDKWKKIFNHLRRLHLIPIVRLATYAVGPVWAVPKEDRFGEWVTFLTSLNWPIENRYVVLFNEPNHANEWGGSVDPEGYAQVLVSLGSRLKDASEDFFILPAGLDASASNMNESMNEAEFLKRMIEKNPRVLQIIDGWTSHSYPNPGFSGSPYAQVRGSLRSFEWELSYLNSLGLNKTLPVFITETGWAHNQGFGQNGHLSVTDVEKNIEIASQNVWRDRRVVAVTPFVFNYQGDPFGQFSWRVKGNHEFYPQYYAYQNISKSQGRPKQQHKFILTSPLVPAVLVSGSTYTLEVDIKNAGQSILRASDGFDLVIFDEKSLFSYLPEPLPVLEPGETGRLTVHLKTPKTEGPFKLEIGLKHNDEKIILEKAEVLLAAPPSVVVRSRMGWKRNSSSSEVTVLIYDDTTLVHKLTGLTMKDGLVKADGLYNIIPGKKYRTVLLVPGYLPRQTITPLLNGQTKVTVKRLLPLDINADGKFDLSDIVAALMMPPHKILNRFFGP